MGALICGTADRVRDPYCAGAALLLSACSIGFPVLSTAEPQSQDRQSREVNIAEVIVTAQKRSERMQDVPVPVTAIDAGVLASANQLRVEDYFRTIPGVALAPAGNGNEPVLTIRGISVGGADLGANPTVGVVVDDVPYGQQVAIGGAQVVAVPDIDPSDLARVEVLRGPQGTLYGASSIGGLLKFVTVDPSVDAFSGRIQFGSVTIEDGDDLGYTARGSLNVPVSSTFAVRLSGFTTRQPGFIDNAETGEEDTNRRDSEGARVSTLWQPNDDFSMKLSAVYQDSKRLGPSEVDTALGEDPQQAFLVNSGVYNRKSEIYTATMNANLGSIELTSATGYVVDQLDDSVDLTTAAGGLFAGWAQDFLGVDRAVNVSAADLRKFSQELRASVPLGDRVNWLVGAFYTDEHQDVFGDTQGADDAHNNAGSLITFTYDDATYREIAGFTNLTVKLSDRWDVQFGGRYSDHKQTFPVVITGALIGDIPAVTPRLEHSDSAFTYLVTPRFQISPDTMLYARFASGFRPGGPNVLCGLSGTPCTFDADTSENYDLGIKGSVGDGVFTYDASVYYIDWSDLQLPGIWTPDMQSQYTGNVSRAESKGVELSVTSHLARGFSVSAWGAYNDAKVAEDFPDGALIASAGDRLPYSARVSGNLILEQRLPLRSEGSAVIAATYSYVGSRPGDFQSTPEREQYPSYTQLNLRTSLEYRSWTLDLFANNVTDKRAPLRTGIDSVFVPSYTVYTEPRTIGLSVTKSF
jgi:iron complex outermembrane recepter protein